MNIKYRAWDAEVKHMYQAGNPHLSMDSLGNCVNLQTGQKLIPLLYTGFANENWVEIYQGDILDCGWKIGWVDFLNGQYVVRYTYEDSKSFSLDSDGNPIFHIIKDCFPLANQYYTSKVIGNKYQNPELLNTLQNQENEKL